MTTYRVPVVIRGYAVVRLGNGRGSGDYVGGLPRDAEFEATHTVPFLCGARLQDFRIDLDGAAEAVDDAMAARAAAG